MTLRSVTWNARTRCFAVETATGTYEYPLAAARPDPGRTLRVSDVYVDTEIGREGFTYALASGEEDTVHLDHVLAFLHDPEYEREMRLHALTVEALRALAESGISRRALSRRMGTSLAQVCRLLDTANTRKSLEQLIRLLHLLGREIRVQVVPAGTPPQA